MRSMVEGLRQRTLINDQPDYGIQIPKHLSRRNSQGPETLLSQPLVANFIAYWIAAHIVGFAVDLDCKL